MLPTAQSIFAKWNIPLNWNAGFSVEYYFLGWSHTELVGAIKAKRIPTDQTRFFRCFLTALYVALLQLGTDYRIATLLFLFAFGAIFLRPSPVHLVRLGLFALVCALLMHWVFTGPLFVDLP